MENVFGMRMGDFGGGSILWRLFIWDLLIGFMDFENVRGPFLGHFWVLEIYENVNGMRMCDFGWVYLVNLSIRELLIRSFILKTYEGPFVGNILVFEIFGNVLKV